MKKRTFIFFKNDEFFGKKLRKTPRYTVDVLGDVGSDHKPILTKIYSRKRKHHRRRTRWNFKKADWELFNEICDQKLKLILETDYTSVDQLCDDITKIILEAAAESIPKGCRKNFKPFWTPEIQDAVSKRETARTILEKYPTDENKIAYNRECANVKRTVNTAKRSAWAKTTGELNLAQDGGKAWSLLNNLSGENRQQNPKPMHADNETIVDDQKKAEKMNKHFASISKATKLTDEDKAKLQDLKAKERAPRANLELFQKDFSMTELNRAMKKLKKHKSPGLDKIHNEMLSNLGKTGKQAILCLINKTWRTGEIPKARKNAIVSPILKKGKPQEDLNSYRPISVTSCLGKLAERMVNSRLYWWLETRGLINKRQAGFRVGYRTEDQLFRLSQRILDGFQRKHHTTAVFVDLKQAYDRVWRKGLLLKMQYAGIHGNLYQ